MNRQLKRIEQTLQQIEKGEAIVVANPVVPPTSPTAEPQVILPHSPTVTVSFDLGGRPKTADSGSRSKISTDLIDLVEPVRDPQAPTKASPVEPFVAQPTTDELPSESKLPSFSQVNSAHSTFTRHNNTVNPDIAINLLQESLKLTTGWRAELQTVVEEIQAVYRSGPIIDGWLECSTQKIDTTTHLLRHAEVNQLMDYVETLCNDPSSTHAEYQLCGLNDDGQVWSSAVPLAQVASISMAIVRHQKLQTLLVQKQVLERRLISAAEAATKFQGQIQAIDKLG